MNCAPNWHDVLHSSFFPDQGGKSLFRNPWIVAIVTVSYFRGWDLTVFNDRFLFYFLWLISDVESLYHCSIWYMVKLLSYDQMHDLSHCPVEFVTLQLKNWSFDCTKELSRRGIWQYMSGLLIVPENWIRLCSDHAFMQQMISLLFMPKTCIHVTANFSFIGSEHVFM